MKTSLASRAQLIYEGRGVTAERAWARLAAGVPVDEIASRPIVISSAAN